jgi:uncharacterized protein YchJ
MSKTRDNHYVPQWYQKGFCHSAEDKLLHLKRKIIDLPDGTTRALNAKKNFTPAQCFYKTDLYTTFFGKSINDEIERKLFGNIDGDGSKAVKAFLHDDEIEWHKNFENLFVYLDAQKLRTPKGLDWIRSKYPLLEQNELMREMQAIRTLHCTLWAEGIRELVSAENSDVKFIISDHPVTIYNYACPPDSGYCIYPNDPDISLIGTQTIFPLSKNRCLILSNVEYVKSPSNSNPLEQRTNATKMRKSMVNTIQFLNKRMLTDDDVTKINYIIKSRSKESVAAGSSQWLYPENDISCDWAELRSVLLPTKSGERYGVEMYASYDDGSTYYQDVFGRTTRVNESLNKCIDESLLGKNEKCGCGSGKKYKVCCHGISGNKRTTWSVLSIRERNLALCRAIKDILGLDKGKTWTDVRSSISEEQITEIYEFHAFLWPNETDIYALLPKPDGKFRAIYTGILDVRMIGDYALGMASHFDEFLVQNPMMIPNNVNPEFSPSKSPESYMYQALKDILFMLSVEPLIDSGIVNLIPDPNNFDTSLHWEAISMARNRTATKLPSRDVNLHRLMIEDLLNSSHMMPHNSKVNMLMTEFSLTKQAAEEIIETICAQEKTEPLVLLKPFRVGKSGQLLMFSVGPNYEMSLFIAQATGSVIVTDSEVRWAEFKAAQHRVLGVVDYTWANLCDPLDVIVLHHEKVGKPTRASMNQLQRLRKLLRSANDLVGSNEIKHEDITLVSREVIGLVEDIKNNLDLKKAKLTILSPDGGFYDASVQRLLLKSNCQHYLEKVNSVYFVRV